MSGDFLSELNDSQREAVIHTEGPSIVIAGAGSGKTKVLTCRIAHMLSGGVSPFNILALTFTNKAAREMKERIALQVGDGLARRLWMGTFHSVFSRILRSEAAHTGFTPDFTIYDTSDSRSLVKSIIKEKGLDDKTYKPANVSARISAAKNHLILPDEYMADVQLRKADAAANMGLTGSIYKEYAERCRRSDAMDFDDLLLHTFLLLRDNAAVRRKYTEAFRYILVDEYQDTNFAQHAIIRLLTEGNNNICVVGDDAQSIYSFRGAVIDNILLFQQQYEGARLFKLERNYRSTRNIVGAANSIIAHNKRQIRKEVYSHNEEGRPLEINRTYSDIDEAELVVRKLRNLAHREHVSYDEMAILYRTNSQSRVFEETFRKHGLPYRIYGGLSFYQRKEIKDVLAYFRLAVNPNDEEALKRVINYPTRGIGATSVGRIAEAAINGGTSMWKVMQSPREYNVGISSATIRKVSEFCTLITSFIDSVRTESASVMAQRIIKASGIWADVTADRSPENLSRQENIQEILNAINSFEAGEQEAAGQDIHLPDYLSQVALLTDADTEDDDEPKVSLMTVHAAKGLEFDAVCVVGIEEDTFPNAKAAMFPADLEEERRLFYVAVTRAKRFCFLSYTLNRYRYGKPMVASRSRFLDEIAPEYVQEEGAGSTSPAPRPTSSFTPSFAPPKLRRIEPSETIETQSHSSASGLTIGDKIEHERFGIGEVKSIVSSGGTYKATVNFQNVGEKTLLLSFARYKKL